MLFFSLFLINWDMEVVLLLSPVNRKIMVYLSLSFAFSLSTLSFLVLSLYLSLISLSLSLSLSKSSFPILQKYIQRDLGSYWFVSVIQPRKLAITEDHYDDHMSSIYWMNNHSSISSWHVKMRLAETGRLLLPQCC